MTKRKTYFYALMIVGMVFLGHVRQTMVLNLLAMVLACGMIFFCENKTAINFLFFFSPFSYIFIYNQYDIFIFIAVAFIIKYLTRRIIKAIMLFPVLLLVYCMAFADPSVNLRIGHFVYPVLLCLTLTVCVVAKQENYRDAVQFFTVGFILSAIIGIFKKDIPSIYVLFDRDYLYIADVETSMSIQRYSGLSYDPNFFALIDCILIAYMLFNYRGINKKNGTQLLFLIIAGFFTFSKSYVLLLAVIVVIYILKNSRYLVRSVVFITLFVVALVLSESYTDIKVLSLIKARFTAPSAANDLTTGRMDIWANYLTYLFQNPKTLFWGEGFNAFALGKAAHNTYIDFIYRFGIIGTMLWALYFYLCYQTVIMKCQNQRIRGIPVPVAVCLAGIMFLSAFHFQQLWCCICISLFSLYAPKEELLCQS